MQTQTMLNRVNNSLGVYNLSNPMINGEYTKEIIDYISSLIQSQILPIQQLIYDETMKIIEPIFQKQINEINELKNELNDLYISYIQKINNFNLGYEYVEQIKLLESEIQNLNNINNNFNEQNNKLCLLKNQLKQGINYDEILLELNKLINLIEKKPNENDMEIDFDINYNKVFKKYKEVKNKLNIINENDNILNIKNKQIENIYIKSCKILEDAKIKIKENESEQKNISEYNYLNNILNFKINEPF
jgi:hypothetical protein